MLRGFNMTVFDNFKNKNIDELAEWLAKYCSFDQAPYWNWWDRNYCNKCESETAYLFSKTYESECAWCELNHKCKFFQELDDIPDSKQIIKMWLLSEVEE